jgi:hypothetical protein
MDKRTAVVLLVGAMGAQGLNRQGLEFPIGEDTPIMSPALGEAIRIVEADEHSHKERNNGPGSPIGRMATLVAATTSTGLSAASSVLSAYPGWGIR